MKITKDEIMGLGPDGRNKEVHLRCDCFSDGTPDTVYGLDTRFTRAKARTAFLASHADKHQEPVIVPPAPLPEPPPAFELVKAGEPSLNADGLAQQRYKVLRHGQAKVAFIAMGKTRTEFVADLERKHKDSQAMILKDEKDRAAASAIVR